MNAFAIWIDREHAKIFRISEEKIDKTALFAKQSEHHTHRQDNFDHQRLEHRLFEDAVAQMHGASRLLILGPGVAKYHFQTFITEHHPALGRKIKGCETVDHPSDAQIEAYAKKFFEIGEFALAKQK